MRAIFFDWDGTIVDSMPAILRTEAAICRHFGLSFDESIFKRTFSPNWRLMYRSLGVPEDRIPEANQIWATTFHSEAMPPFRGVEDALARLAAAGYALGIVTSADRAEIEPVLSRLGLDELLRVRVFADDTEEGKPTPDHCSWRWSWPASLSRKMPSMSETRSTTCGWPPRPVFRG
jgi:phosphoglycolate phosphatase-like HAD superfamily hydrolase